MSNNTNNSTSLKMFSVVKDNSKWELYLKILLVFSFVFISFLALNTGINGDEDVQELQSLSLFDWYATGGDDQSYLTSKKGDNIRYYGGFYELTSSTVNKILGYEINDSGFHTSRHLLVGVFGFFILFFGSRLGKLFHGPKLGFLIVLLLLFSPRFIGHAVMNPKDIPFALGYIMAIYFMLKWLKNNLALNKWILGGLVLGLTIAIGTRINGVLLIFYWGMLLLIHAIANGEIKTLFQKNIITKYLRVGLIPVIIGLICAFLFWPYGLISPIDHTMEAMDAFSNFAIGIKSLFNGVLTWSTEIPLKYLGTWMLISIPLIVLIGFVVFVGLFRKMIKQYGFIGPFMMLFSFAFPFFYVLIKGSSLYDGWRHFNFIYVPFAIVASMGFILLLEWKPKFKMYILGLILIGIAEPAFHIVKNYTIPYVYFNQIAGGSKGTFGEFEQDYWGISVTQGFEWLSENGHFNDSNKKYVVHSNFWYTAKHSALKYDNVKFGYSKFRQRYDKEWDYAIFVGRYIDPGQLKGGYWPPMSALHSIKVNGVPVAVIYKKDPFVVDGLKDFKSGNNEGAILNLDKAVSINSDNDIAWSVLGDLYSKKGDSKNALNAYSNSLRINKEDIKANVGLGLLYLNSGDVNKAKSIFIDAIKVNNHPNFHYYLALIYKNEKDSFTALKHAKKAIELNQRFLQAYQLASQIYSDMGDNVNAQKYASIVKQIRK